MSEESNLALIHSWIDEVVNKGNMDIIDKLMHVDYYGVGGTREEYKQDALRQSFPDGIHTVEDIAADGNKVWVRYTIRGTYTGTPFFGIPVNGNKIEVTNVCIYHIKDGKIIKIWGIVDMLSFWQQLGVISPMKRLFKKARNTEDE